jgi:hypothetical protein
MAWSLHYAPAREVRPKSGNIVAGDWNGCNFRPKLPGIPGGDRGNQHTGGKVDNVKDATPKTGNSRLYIEERLQRGGDRGNQHTGGKTSKPKFGNTPPAASPGSRLYIEERLQRDHPAAPVEHDDAPRVEHDDAPSGANHQPCFGRR